jgi:hypothetical protein
MNYARPCTHLGRAQRGMIVENDEDTMIAMIADNQMPLKLGKVAGALLPRPPPSCIISERSFEE